MTADEHRGRQIRDVPPGIVHGPATPSVVRTPPCAENDGLHTKCADYISSLPYHRAPIRESRLQKIQPDKGGQQQPIVAMKTPRAQRWQARQRPRFRANLVRWSWPVSLPKVKLVLGIGRDGFRRRQVALSDERTFAGASVGGGAAGFDPAPRQHHAGQNAPDGEQAKKNDKALPSHRFPPFCHSHKGRLRKVDSGEL